jgi:hypothetical protein
MQHSSTLSDFCYLDKVRRDVNARIMSGPAAPRCSSLTTGELSDFLCTALAASAPRDVVAAPSSEL